MVARSENRLLAALPRGVRRRFVASCDHVALKLHDILAEAGEQIRHVYFPTAGFISLVVTLDNGAPLEVGIIGNKQWIRFARAPRLIAYRDPTCAGAPSSGSANQRCRALAIQMLLKLRIA
jgi:hypothetical protein